MKILLIDEQHSLIIWSAVNHEYKTIYVVAYGLSIKHLETYDQAFKAYTRCKDHFIQCNKD